MKYEHELRLKQMEVELARINVVLFANWLTSLASPVNSVLNYNIVTSFVHLACLAIVRLCEDFFLKALSPAQAQLIRRNKGCNSVVDAAEDYILPTISPKGSSSRENVRLHNIVDSRKCYNCDRIAINPR
jgi:hypothetical protein